MCDKKTEVSRPSSNRKLMSAVTTGVALLGLLVGAGRANAAVPNPTVIGPVPATVPPGDPSHNYPFFSTIVDLASYGYVEEEFFFEGTANRYSTPDLATGSIIDSGHPYRTRMVVRRPASPANFNGTVVMEWQNVSKNYDIDLLWEWSYQHIIRRGYAWIGVSAQQAGIHTPVTGLKAWSPNRYGTLDVTQGGTILNDALAYDIFSQAAQAVRSPSGVDPMGGLRVERVFAAGGSQSANLLVAYHNAIHPLAGVFDGFLIVVGGGLLRTDLDAKVFKVLTETEIDGRVVVPLPGFHNQVPFRQPASDRFRRWEVAGTSHIDFRLIEALTPLPLRDGVPPFRSQCDLLPPWSRIPFAFALNAAYDHMVAWVKHDIQPPSAPDIDLASYGPPAVVARDGYGNALGGVRLSQHAVPTATNTGYNLGPGFCVVFGSFQPFDAATLDALYRNHGAYVSRVSNVTVENLLRGFLVQEDAEATIKEAARSETGKH